MVKTVFRFKKVKRKHPAANIGSGMLPWRGVSVGEYVELVVHNSFDQSDLDRIFSRHPAVEPLISSYESEKMARGARAASCNYSGVQIYRRIKVGSTVLYAGGQ